MSLIIMFVALLSLICGVDIDALSRFHHLLLLSLFKIHSLVNLKANGSKHIVKFHKDWIIRNYWPVAAVVAYRLPVDDSVTTELNNEDSPQCVLCWNTEKNQLWRPVFDSAMIVSVFCYWFPLWTVNFLVTHLAAARDKAVCRDTQLKKRWSRRVQTFLIPALEGGEMSASRTRPLNTEPSCMIF